MRAGWLASAALLAALAGPSLAQNVYAPAVTVNNAVVTGYDVEQRVLLLDALGAPDVNRRELAVQQLTEDRVKLQAAESMGIELPEGAIEAGLQEFAAGRGPPRPRPISTRRSPASPRRRAR